MAIDNDAVLKYGCKLAIELIECCFERVRHVDYKLVLLEAKDF